MGVFGRLWVGWVMAARIQYGLQPRPMRRRIDRVEARIGAALLVVSLIGMPGAAAVAGAVVWEEGAGAARSQTVTRHRVRAVLAEDAPDPASSGRTRAWARWPMPDGSARVGEVPAHPPAKAGSTTMIWIDDGGHLVAPPAGLGRAWTRALIAAGLAWSAVSLVLCGMRLTVGRCLDRRRMRRWEETWARIEPRWTPRYHR